MICYTASHLLHLLRGSFWIEVGRVPVGRGRRSPVHDQEVDEHQRVGATVVIVGLTWGVSRIGDSPPTDFLNWRKLYLGVGHS